MSSREGLPSFCRVRSTGACTPGTFLLSAQKCPELFQKDLFIVKVLSSSSVQDNMGQYRRTRISVLRKRGPLAPSRFALPVLGYGGPEFFLPTGLFTSVITASCDASESAFLGVLSN